MLLGGLPMSLAGILLESDRWQWPSTWPAFGLAYNVVVAFMFCYWAWNRIVLMVPVQVSSLSSLVTPVIGVVGGMLFLGEQPGWQEVAGAGLILGGGGGGHRAGGAGEVRRGVIAAPGLEREIPDRCPRRRQRPGVPGVR